MYKLLKKNFFVYVLQCDLGKWYVGKTKNPEFRIENHFSGNGAEWTNLFPPISLFELIPNVDKFEEDKVVLFYMNIFGIDNVRGGCFSKIKLDINLQKTIELMLTSANDKCFICKSKQHFAKDCPNKPYISKQESPKKKQKFYKNDNSSDEYLSSEEYTSEDETISCYRCERVGHSEYECFAKTDCYGNKI